MVFLREREGGGGGDLSNFTLLIGWYKLLCTGEEGEKDFLLKTQHI